MYSKQSFLWGNLRSVTFFSSCPFSVEPEPQVKLLGMEDGLKSAGSTPEAREGVGLSGSLGKPELRTVPHWR